MSWTSAEFNFFFTNVTNNELGLVNGQRLTEVTFEASVNG